MLPLSFNEGAISFRVTVTVFVGDTLSLAAELLSFGEDLHEDLSAFSGDFGLLNTGKPLPLPAGVALVTRASCSAGNSVEVATSSVFVFRALADMWFPEVSSFTAGCAMLCDMGDLDALRRDWSFPGTGEDVRLEGALLDCLRAFLVPSGCGELAQLLDGLWSLLVFSSFTLTPACDTGSGLELSEELFLDAMLCFWSSFRPLPTSGGVLFCPCNFFPAADDDDGLGDWLAPRLTTS